MWLLGATSLNKACGTVSMLAMRPIFKAYKTVIFPCSNQLNFRGLCSSRKSVFATLISTINKQFTTRMGFDGDTGECFKSERYVVKWLCAFSLPFVLSVLAPLQTLRKPVYMLYLSIKRMNHLPMRVYLLLSELTPPTGGHWYPQYPKLKLT